MLVPVKTGRRKSSGGMIGLATRASIVTNSATPTRPSPIAATTIGRPTAIVGNRGEPIGERAEGEHRDRRAPPVDRARGGVIPVLRDMGEGEPERDCGYRDVDPEDDAPGQKVDEKAAERRAEGGGDRRCRRPRADRTTAHLLREGRRDDGERLRHEQRRPDALHHARDDQRADGRGERAGNRGKHEQANAENEDQSAAGAVAEAAADQDERAEEEQIGVGHPLHFGQRRAQAALHRRQRDGDDAAVDEGQRRGGDGGGEDPGPARIGRRPAAVIRPPRRPERSPRARRARRRDRTRSPPGRSSRRRRPAAAGGCPRSATGRPFPGDGHACE